MKKYFLKLQARLLYALGIIDKQALKKRTRLVALSESNANQDDFTKGFIEKFGIQLSPGIFKFDVSRVDVGQNVYGELNVLMSNKDGEKLVIGNCCSIAVGVTFILASEHPYKGLSTYPFKVKLGFQECEAVSKGDIIVGDDVWIGLKATICSGVKIGQGAIVAAGSVVVKDVPPYAIVGGNPAKFIKWRFDDEAVRERLMRLDWSKFNKGAVNKDNVVDLYAPASLSGIDDLERRFFTK